MSTAKLTKAMNGVMADSFVLYFKTHAFHWNVTGPQFKSLHELFEEQYTEIWQALDDLAERQRTLGVHTANNPADFMKNATLEHVSQTPDANTLIEMLANDNRAIVKTLDNAIEAAIEVEDDATEDLLIARKQAHQKAAWMLESSIDKAA